MLSWHILKTTLYFNWENEILNVNEIAYKFKNDRDIWYKKLSEAASYDAKFEGNTNYKKAKFHIWYIAYKKVQDNMFYKNKNITEEQKQGHLKLNKLLATYDKNVKKIMKMATKTNKSNGAKKQKNFKKVVRYYDRLEKLSKEIIIVSNKLIHKTEDLEFQTFQKLSLQMDKLNNSFHKLEMNIQKEVEFTKDSLMDYTSRVNTLLIITIIIVIIISIFVSLYITKNITSSIGNFKDGLSNFF